MTRRFWIIAALSILLLSGCSGDVTQGFSSDPSSASSSFLSESSSEISPVSSSVSSKSQSDPFANYITGHSLDEIGLVFCPDYTEFANSDIYRVFAWNETMNTHNVLGNRTIVHLYYSYAVNAPDADRAEIMALWGFLKSEIKEDSVTTWRGSDKYTMKDLEPYKVYENDTVVVFDVWELVNQKTVEEYLNTMGNNFVSPAELIAAYKQVKAYPGGILGLAE